MKKQFLLGIALLFSTFITNGQTAVDEVRIYFDEASVNSKQVGMDVSVTGRYIAFAFEDGRVKIYDQMANQFISTHDYGFSSLLEILFTKEEDQLVIVDKTGWVLVNWKTKREIHREPMALQPTRSTLGNKNNWLAIGTMGAEFSVFDLDKKEKIFQGAQKKLSHIGGIDFSHEDKYLLVLGKKNILYTTGMNASLEVYDMSSKESVGLLKKSMAMAPQWKKDNKIAYYNFSLVNWDPIAEPIKKETLDLNAMKTMKQSATSAEDFIFGGSSAIFESNIIISDQLSGFVMYDAQSRMVFTTRKGSGDGKKIKGKAVRNVGNIDGIGANNIKQIANSSKFIINSFGNNINHIFDAEKREIIGYIYADSNDDHALIARDGRVDGTPETFSKLEWTERRSNKRLPLNVNLDQFITPRLYTILTSGDGKFDNTRINNSIAFAPTLSISSPDSISTSTNSTAAISYITSSNGDPVKSVTVTVNGKTMSEGTRGFKRLDESVTVSLVGGRNVIMLNAVSEKGYESVPDQVIVNYSGAPAKSELYMLTIGLNQYKNVKYNLNYATADAMAFNEKLEKGSHEIFTEVKKFFIEDSDATKEKIERTFQEISNTIGPEDVFVFYYAGHGVMSEEDKPLFYIIPHDVTQLYGNTEMLKEKAISANQLKLYSSQISAQKQLFILDACQSGGMTDMLAMRGAAEEKAIAQLARSTGTYWLTASGSEQFATEFAELGHGLFTYTLLEGLSGKADGGSMDKKITIKELSAYLNDRVPELSEQHKGQPQYPTSYGFGQDFPVVIVK